MSSSTTSSVKNRPGNSDLKKLRVVDTEERKLPVLRNEISSMSSKSAERFMLVRHSLRTINSSSEWNDYFRQRKKPVVNYHTVIAMSMTRNPTTLYSRLSCQRSDLDDRDGEIGNTRMQLPRVIGDVYLQMGQNQSPKLSVLRWSPMANLSTYKKLPVHWLAILAMDIIPEQLLPNKKLPNWEYLQCSHRCLIGDCIQVGSHFETELSHLCWESADINQSRANPGCGKKCQCGPDGTSLHLNLCQCRNIHQPHCIWTEDMFQDFKQGNESTSITNIYDFSRLSTGKKKKRVLAEVDEMTAEQLEQLENMFQFSPSDAENQQPNHSQTSGPRFSTKQKHHHRHFTTTTANDDVITIN